MMGMDKPSEELPIKKSKIAEEAPKKIEGLPGQMGNRTTPTPSYVTFTCTERFIEDATKNQVTMNPTNTIFRAKKLIRRKFNETTVQVWGERDNLAMFNHFNHRVI